MKNRIILSGAVLYSVLVMLTTLCNAQSNPAAQNLPYSQNFGTSTFTSMPTGMAAWTVNGAPKTSQSSAESSTGKGDATITASEQLQTIAGCYGHNGGSNGLFYLMTGSDTTNGTNQAVAAVVTSGLKDIKISYHLYSDPHSVPIGVVLQYRSGTSGSWSTISGTYYLHDSTDRTLGQADVYSDLAVPSGANDQSVVQFRWCTWNGGSGVRYSGVVLDNIVISGTYITDSAYFRSKQSGNWNTASSWEMSYNNSTWFNAPFTPDYTCRTILIQSGHTITLNASTEIDEVTVDGTLVYADYSGSVLTVRNGDGTDLTINGTFSDDGPSAVSWATGAVWEMGSGGTLIRTRATSGEGWRDHYSGGISNIPASSSWIVRRTGTDTPALITLGGMYYPNLYIENNTGSFSCGFDGSDDYPRIKGNLYIGGNGSQAVTFENFCNNTTLIPVDGNINVNASCLLLNSGSGFEVKGNIQNSGNISHQYKSGRQWKFSGTAEQTLGGSGGYSFSHMIVEKTAGDLVLNSGLTVDSKLEFVSGKIEMGSVILTIDDSCTITGADSNSYIISGMNSRVRKRYPFSTFVFPLGDASFYSPFSLTYSSGTPGTNPSVDVGVATLDTLNSYYENNIKRFWHVNVNSITDLQVNASMIYCESDVHGDETLMEAMFTEELGESYYIGTVNPAINNITFSGELKPGGYFAADICGQTVGTITGSTTVCKGQPAFLYACCGGNYLWSTGSTLPEISVYPAQTTSYYLTVTNEFGCPAYDTIEISVLDIPSVSMSPDTIICKNAETLITASGGLYYHWNTGSHNDSLTVSPSENAVYTVTVTNQSGCTASASTTVQVREVNADAGEDHTICFVQPDTLTATGGVSYLWSTGDSSASVYLTPSASAYYSVVVTDSSGCIGTDSVYVEVMPELTATDTADICMGDTAWLVASGGGTYNWSTNDTTDSVQVSPSSSELYWVTITNGTCSNTAWCYVNVHSFPTADAGMNHYKSCPGIPDTLTASGGYTYLWSTGDSTATIFVNPEATTTYYVSVSNPYGCISTDSVSVIISNPNPLADAGPDHSLCRGMSDTLTASGGGSYLWSTGASTASIVISPDSSTLYTVTVSYATGCQATDQVMVTVYEVPIADAGADRTICQGRADTLTATGGTEYWWSTDQTTASIVVSPDSIMEYRVRVTANGCSAWDTVVVNVNPAPFVDAGSDRNICYGDTAHLQADYSGIGSGNFAWNTGDTLSGIVVQPPMSSIYTISATDQNGCLGSDQVQVVVYPLPNADAGFIQSIASGDTAVLTASGGSSYEWSTSDTTATLSVWPAITTVYYVTVSNTYGCSDADDVAVLVGSSQMPYPESYWQKNDSVITQVSSVSKVGIGTSNPTERLTVGGNLLVDGRIISNRITSPDSLLYFGDSTLVLNTSTHRIYPDGSGLYKGMALGQGSFAQAPNSITIGKYVRCPASAVNSVLIGSAPITGGSFISSIPNSLIVGFNSGYNAVPTLLVGPAGGTNNLATGNVGISTSNPTDKLQIGEGEQSISFGSAMTSPGYLLGYVGFNARRERQENGWQPTSVWNSSGNKAGGVIAVNAIGAIEFMPIAANSLTNIPDADLFNLKVVSISPGFYNGTELEGASMEVFGSLIVNEELRINSNLRVCNKIMAGEIEVRLDWCDYVFDPDYELMTLEERENYIFLHKHLPYIASGKEVQENGANLGQAVVGILRNTEELNLYVFEMNKRLDQLKSENSELKKRLLWIEYQLGKK